MPIISLLIAIAVFGGVWCVRAAGKLQNAELVAYDALLRMRTPDDSMADRVVVIGVTEDDLQDETVHFPVRDGELQAALKTLLALGPRAIGVDIYRDLSVPGPPGTRPTTAAAAGGDSYSELVNLLKSDDRIVTLELWGKNRPLVRPPNGVPTSQVGFADLPEDDDGVVRRGLYNFGDSEGKTHYSLAARLASRYVSRGPQETRVTEWARRDLLRLGRGEVPCIDSTSGSYIAADAGATQYLFDYRGRRDPLQFRPIPIGRLFSSDNPLRPEEIRDKVVLIGMTTRSVKDLVRTPLASDIYGVEQHARAVDQLLRARVGGKGPDRWWSDRSEMLWTLGWALFGAMLGYLIREPWRFVIGLVLGLILLYAVAFTSIQRGWWIPLVPPVLSCLAAAFGVTQFVSFSEGREKKLVRQVFEPFVSRELADVIWTRRHELIRDGRWDSQEVVASILFTDVKGFSGIAKVLKPRELMAWLNDYIGTLSEMVRRHGGMVVTYMGDGMMAAFGAPVTSNDPLERRAAAVNAVACAVAMRKALTESQSRWSQLVGRPVRMRVGIVTGPVSAGCVGGGKRLEYALIGDTVNTASRLESFNKQLMSDDIAVGGCRIVIGPGTAELVEGRFSLKPLGLVKLDGMEQPLEVFAVLGASGNMSDAAEKAVAARQPTQRIDL